ncbi:MAG: S8 family peptidase [Bacteroides sp.]|nr:S8 family peptidase [Bacteroides sp.]
MNRFFILTLLMGATSLFVEAQCKLNPQGQLILQQYKAERVEHVNAAGGENAAPVETALVKLNPGYNAADIESLGFKVNTDLGEIITVTLPLDRVEELDGSDAVKSISLGGRESLMTNFARESSNVDAVQTGFEHEGAQVSYDGTGVVAGMMDTGLEANHVNFTDAAGDTRFGALWHFTGSDGNNSVREYNSRNISRFSSDSKSETHATHVLGIMAGSYNRTSKYVDMTSPTSGVGKVENGNNPYYGVATGSTIAASVGSLTHANIIDGVANIVSYAEENDMPCVVNMSLGSTYGPHDGTDDYTAALSVLGKRAVIVMAAGNDGDKKLSIEKTFAAGDTQLKTLIAGNEAKGIVDVWGGDRKPFSLSWAIYDKDKQQLVILATSAQNQRTYVNSQNSTFAAAFNGTIDMYAMVDPNNNRYNVFSTCSATPKTGNTTKLLALVIDGEAGQQINVYGNDVTFENPYWSGWTGGSADDTINNACCADNILSVGAYTTRTNWSTLAQNGSYYYPGSTIDAICSFSSYGKSFSGEQLPLVAAPGSTLVSSYNSDYVKAAASENDMIASAQGNIGTDYWGQMQGTSMACPMVSGIVALWLQADPTLDYAGVMEVINATSVTDRYTRKAPERFGAGKIDALAGIKKVLDEKASVGAIFADEARNFILTPIEGGYNVYVAGESSLTVTLYDMSGRAVAGDSADENTVDISTSSLAKGIYLLTAQGATQRHSAKIIVK